MDKLVETQFPYPVADTEGGPLVSYTDANVTLSFVDYKGIPRRVTFRDVPFLNIASIDSDQRALYDDRVYAVEDSSVIDRLTQIGEISSAHHYTHQIICFNEAGIFLEIVYRRCDTTNA